MKPPRPITVPEYRLPVRELEIVPRFSRYLFKFIPNPLATEPK